ncbi:MAG: AAA family ATPase [Eggerthellaceae bacterium]|jgi:uncharacterized protein YhaN|nr:AAA family ATPase [Eggerthellaceae bacterium]MDR2715825.1 AAA family ATPase [Coriobacteriaceae bacterium]
MSKQLLRQEATDGPAPAEKAGKDVGKTTEGVGKRTGTLFLRRIKVVSFGAFSNKVIGPFAPGMNVVFGRNEGGKTTLNALVSGILFGWEEARGIRNTYKPENAERSGSLFFEDEAAEEELEVFRVKNTDGLQGWASLVDDIDKETFLTMFGLTSDELRSLRNTTDVTAKLLTAGSGTSASPAYALAEIQSRIAEHTSKAAGLDCSIVQLTQRQAELREALSEAADEADRLKLQDKEFHELGPERDNILVRLQTLNTEIESLSAARASLEELEQQQRKNLKQKRKLLDEERALAAQHQERGNDGVSKLVGMKPEQEYMLRDRIDTLLEESSKIEHSVFLAKEDHTSSKAAFEVLHEAGDLKEAEQKARFQRQVQMVSSIILPVLFAAIGAFILLHGWKITSLSFTALGIFVILFAILLAGAAFIMLFRPPKTEDALLQRKQDAQWVMLQDRKKLEACEAERGAQEEKVRDFLKSNGLKEARGSLKRARALLDEAKDRRAQRNLTSQKKQALASQLVSLEEAIAENTAQRERAFAQVGVKEDTPLSALDLWISQKTQQRASLAEARDSINRRYGELKQELSQAKHLRSFDELKLAYQQVRTRQKESMQDYARLLLAKRMLENAIGAWESKSQPEVYKQASRLLALMTSGKWVKIRMSPEGRIQVVDDVKTVREPIHLSLATCQQLYLSLRIALLMTAENVGRALPVLADDILVNFDVERSRGAVKALFELSTRRQVILFTCHEEIVRLLRENDSQVNVLEL